MLNILLTGAGLSMDAFAAAVTNALSTPGWRPRHAAVTAAYFGLFQGVMPLLGWLLGNSVSGLVSAFGPYVSFFLLAFIGLHMIVESLKGEAPQAAGLNHAQLAATAFATSLDAFAVGVSFAFTYTPPLMASAVIAAETFAVCFAGGLAAACVSGVSRKISGVIGGLVLCGIGARLLLDGLEVI